MPLSLCSRSSSGVLEGSKGFLKKSVMDELWMLCLVILHFCFYPKIKHFYNHFIGYSVHWHIRNGSIVYCILLLLMFTMYQFGNLIVFLFKHINLLLRNSIPMASPFALRHITFTSLLAPLLQSFPQKFSFLTKNLGC